MYMYMYIYVYVQILPAALVLFLTTCLMSFYGLYFKSDTYLMMSHDIRRRRFIRKQKNKLFNLKGQGFNEHHNNTHESPSKFPN